MLKKIPWKDVKATLGMIRRRYYTVEWPEHRRHAVTFFEPDDFERRLRDYHNFEGVLLSYDYERQEIELRKPIGYRGDIQRELHLRGRWNDKQFVTEIVAHTEASRYEHKTEHIESEDIDWQEGHQMMLDLISDIEGDG